MPRRARACDPGRRPQPGAARRTSPGSRAVRERSGRERARHRHLPARPRACAAARSRLGRPRGSPTAPGYDNQPAFSADGRSLYFTAIEDGQSDIQRYDLATPRRRARSRSTPESEFSPTPAPDGRALRGARRGERHAAALALPGGRRARAAAARRQARRLPRLGRRRHARAVRARRPADAAASPIAAPDAPRRWRGDVGRCIRPVPGRAGRQLRREGRAGRVVAVRGARPALARRRRASRACRRASRTTRGSPDGRVVWPGQGARLLELPRRRPGVARGRALRRRRAAEHHPPRREPARRPAGARLGRGAALRADAWTASCAAPSSSATRRPACAGPGDSKELFFEWRKPGEDEAATWVVARAGGEPRRLSDEERRQAPAADCEWDEARRRCLFVAGRRHRAGGHASPVRGAQITRTTASAESDPRFARGDTAVDVRARQQPLPRAARRPGRPDWSSSPTWARRRRSRSSPRARSS